MAHKDSGYQKHTNFTKAAAVLQHRHSASKISRVQRYSHVRLEVQHHASNGRHAIRNSRARTAPFVGESEGTNVY